MKVLVVTQYFWPESFRINDLVERLVEKGHNVDVLTAFPNYPKGTFYKNYPRVFLPCEEIYKGARIIRCPLFPRFSGRGWQLAMNYLSFAVSSTIVMFLKCNKNYDVIFCMNYSPITQALAGVFKGKVSKIPLFLWVQDLWPESISATGTKLPSFAFKLIRKCVDYIYRSCRYILVQSKGFVSHVEQAKVSIEKIKFFPNWAEALYQPLALESLDKDDERLPDSGFKVVFAGNIGEAQDFPIIVEAAEKLKDYNDIKWVILGDGRKKKWLDKEIKKRKLEDHFLLLGRKPMETMPKFFCQADILLSTLKHDPIFERTIPGKIQSYLAVGKPVLTNVGGSGALVVNEAQAGIGIEPGDSKKLADSILKLYHMSFEARVKLGQNGREYFLKNFERELLISRLEEWFREVKA